MTRNQGFAEMEDEKKVRSQMECRDSPFKDKENVWWVYVFAARFQNLVNQIMIKVFLYTCLGEYRGTRKDMTKG